MRGGRRRKRSGLIDEIGDMRSVTARAFRQESCGCARGGSGRRAPGLIAQIHAPAPWRRGEKLRSPDRSAFGGASRTLERTRPCGRGWACSRDETFWGASPLVQNRRHGGKHYGPPGTWVQVFFLVFDRVRLCRTPASLEGLPQSGVEVFSGLLRPIDAESRKSQKRTESRPPSRFRFSRGIPKGSLCLGSSLTKDKIATSI